MTILIRPVTPSDAPAWQHLRELLWEGDDHRSEIARYFRGEAEEPNEVLLAISAQDQVIAHIELSLRDDIDGLAGLRTGYIEGLYVVQQHRATGVTQQLLRAAASWALEQGCLAFASDRDGRVIIHARYAAAAAGAWPPG